MGALARLDALSGLANIASVAPKLVMTNLNDASIVWPAYSGSGQFYWTDIIGSDSLGYGPSSMSGALNSTGLIRREVLIAAGDVVAGTATDIDAVFDIQTAANDFPGGRGKKVVMKQLKRTPAEWSGNYPQVWNAIYYRSNWNNPLPPLCYRFQMKLPSNMIDVLADNPANQGWSEEFALKSNINNNLIDSRVALKTIRAAGESQLRFRLDFDIFDKRIAWPDPLLEGNSLSPGVPLNLWYMQSALGAAIPGDTYDIYIYFKPPVNKTDYVTGLCQILIVNISQNTIALCDEMYGVPMKGYYNYEMAKVLTQGIYIGGFPSVGNIQIEYSGMQFWSRMPVI